jgi:hypothetical protein
MKQYKIQNRSQKNSQSCVPLSVYGKYGILGLFVVHQIVSECAASIKTHSENTRKEFMRTWRRRKETLGVFSLYAKRYKSVYTVSPLIIIQI